MLGVSMKTLLWFGASLALVSTAYADSWTGTLVDVMCKGKDVANHTRQCALSCAKGGYGLVLSDGKFVKLDETGNAMTLSKLKTSTKDKDLKAKVTGKLDGEVIQVETVDLQ
jgi:hypothetical protein